ncbi:MAG: hypothetical protein E5X64_02530 [Mesorhizobium sp.]|nr:MAG: hypothetical protein E5X64_02530 [Mesorhizobium sp.]TJV92035.1 MAG: hypothetical protein E5X84_08505 [Mesorhizobium sp.]
MIDTAKGDQGQWHLSILVNNVVFDGIIRANLSQDRPDPHPQIGLLPLPFDKPSKHPANVLGWLREKIDDARDSGVGWKSWMDLLSSH